MSDEVLPPPQETERYSGLPRLLHSVRWTQHLLSIVAEVLILLSFAMSGMDVSLGGVMASVQLLKTLWAGMFALGIDTAFALSWVRVRQCALNRHWWAFIWNLLLAFGISVIVFQPIAIQLLQQSLNLDFNHAVANLGINIVFLTYARAAVAVFLGAIMAVTNVEHDIADRQETNGPRRRLVLFESLLNRIAPVVDEETLPELPAPDEDISRLPTDKLPALPEPKQSSADTQTSTHNALPVEATPEERADRIKQLDTHGLSNAERVAKVLALFPTVSDRELGKLCGLSAATAKKYRNKVQA